MQIVVYAEDNLVKRHPGTMPVILTCPHGGSEEPPGVDVRTDPATPPGCDFQDSRDNKTIEITEAVAQKILDLTGLSPYVVIARYHRKFIDANRTRDCAFIADDPEAPPFYDEYHQRIDEFLQQLLSQNGNRGFLFDIHGTLVIPEDQADVYIGTANGSSLVPGFDRGSIFMQHGLHGLLKASTRLKDTGGQITVFQYGVSPVDENAAETSQVSGGFTIRNYGPRVNSIQIEIADTIRDDNENRGFFAEDLALAMVNSVRRYAPF